MAKHINGEIPLLLSCEHTRAGTIVVVRAGGCSCELTHKDGLIWCGGGGLSLWGEGKRACCLCPRAVQGSEQAPCCRSSLHYLARPRSEMLCGYTRLLHLLPCSACTSVERRSRV